MGLTTEKRDTIGVKPMFSTSLVQQKVHVYDLTDAGRKAPKPSTSAMSAHQFCYRTPEVNEVTQSTEPSAAFGVTVSSVPYTYKAKYRASWSTDPAMQDAFSTLKQTASDSNESKAEVVLTNNGWVDARGSKL